jgi:alkylation response protein AidB-like acyl-CoA dehydrogenase
VVAALGIEPRPDRAALLPAFGSWEPPVSGGIATERLKTASELVVGTALVPMTSVRATPVHGIDPEANFQMAEMSVTLAALGGSTWNTAVECAQRAIAHQIAGATRAMLDLARQHALDRVQFGRPIAHFQAVRHRLADALVAIEALDATLAAAADDPGDSTAVLAKITAGQTARAVVTHCQQVLAGVGFTTGHPFHRYLKRTMLLDGLFGRADDLVVMVGRQLLEARRVPTLIEL